AAYVLGEMGAADERKASDFISCLTDALEAQTEDTVFGRALVQAISKVGKYTAHILLTFLQVDSEYVRCGVIQILGNVASSPDWTPDGEIIPGLIDILFDPGTTDTVRKETITSLAKIGKHAVSELISALDSEDAYVRAVAAEALGDPHNKDAIVPLGEKLKDAEVSVRKAAAIALGQIYDVQAVPFLKEALRDPEADVRTATIRTLVQIGSYRHEANQNMRAQMITDLIDIVAVDESQTVHPEIMVALVQLGATEHQLFTASQAGLQNENFAVRELAITDLRGLPREFPDLRGNVVLALLDSLADDVLSVFQAASMSLSILTADKEEIASGCVAAVASQKKSGNMHVRLAALELLNGLNVKNEGVERGLRECLSDDEISVRIAARKIIAGFDYSFVDEIEVVVEGAVKNLEHEDHDVRINAVMNVLQGSYQYELWSYAVDAAVEMAGKIGADTDVNAKRTEEIKRDIVKRLNEVAEQFHTEHENRSDYLWLINRGVAALGGQGTQQMEAVTETEEREDIKRRVMDLVDQADDLGTPILDVMTLTWLRDLYENNTFTDDENRRGCIVIITNHVPEFGTKLDFEQQKRVIIAAHDYSKGIIPDAEEADTSAGVTPPDGPRAPPTGVGVPGGPAGPEVLGGPEAPAAEAPENTIEINYDALDKLVAGHVKAFGDTEKSLYLEPQTSRAFPNEKSKITPPKGAKWTRVFLGALLIVVSIAMHARYGSMVGMGVYLGIGILGAAMIAKAFLGRYLQDSSAAPDRAKEQDRTVEEMQETLEGINASMARASYFETIGGDSSLLCGLSSTMEEVYFTDWSHERLAQLRDIMLVQTKTVSDNLNQLDVDLADEEADEIKEILTGAVNNEFKTYKRALRLTAESIAGYIQQQLPELQELERKFNADQTYNNREELEKKRDEIRRAIREMSAARGIPKFDKEQEGQFTAAVGSLKAYKDLGEMIKKFKDLKIERSDSAELQAWLQAMGESALDVTRELMLLTGEPFATYRRRIVLSVQNVREYLQQELPELRTLEQQLGAREQQLRTQGMRKDFESDPAYSLYKRNVIKKTAKIKKRVGALLKGESNDIFIGNRTALEILSAPVVEDVLELDAVERRRLDMIDLHRVTEGWSKDELRDLLRRTVKGRAQVDDHGRMRDINRIDDESALKRLIVENQGVSGPVYKHNFIPVIESSMKELAELERRRHNTRDDITRQLSSPRILRAGRWITGIGKTVSGWQKKISEQLDRWGERVDGWLRKIDYASEKDGVFSWSLKIAYYALAVITPISRAALKLALFLLRKVFKIAVVAAIVYGCMSYMPYALPYFIFMGNWTFLGMTASGALAV
ncbi:MAG: HEAT repeat domain-containing protein, partial [Candidatus Omnitrophota bacterium]